MSTNFLPCQKKKNVETAEIMGTALEKLETFQQPMSKASEIPKASQRSSKVINTSKIQNFLTPWFIMSLSVLLWTQEKRMDELNLFIEYYSKYIVSIIWQRYVLTLHLSHTNCCKSCNASGSCCQFAPTCYVIHLIESYQNSSKVKPFQMLNNGTLILLYFALRTVSVSRANAAKP